MLLQLRISPVLFHFYFSLPLSTHIIIPVHITFYICLFLTVSFLLLSLIMLTTSSIQFLCQFYLKSFLLTIKNPKEEAFSKHSRKGEKALYKPFLFFPHHNFYPIKQIFYHLGRLKLLSAKLTLSIWTRLKFCPLVKM